MRLVLHGFGGLPQEIAVAGKKIALTNDATPLLKPSAGYDPLGAAQGSGAGRTQAKALIFGLSAEEFSVKW